MSVSKGAYSTAVPPHSVGATPQETGLHVRASTLYSVSSDSTQSAATHTAVQMHVSGARVPGTWLQQL